MVSCTAGQKHTCGFQASSTNQKSVDIGLLDQIFAVSVRHTATVDNSIDLCTLGGDFLGQPLADCSMSFLGLSGGSNFTCADGPVRRQLFIPLFRSDSRL